MPHNHHHHHDHGGEKNIASAFFLNVFFVIIEIVGGLLTNSFAILSDALHDLGDTIGLAISWYLEKISHKKKDARFSLGYRRFSLLAALINSLVLLIGSIIIISEVIPRLFHPHHSDAGGMFILSVFGIGIHGLAAYRLRKGKTLNEKAASLHLLEDTYGWIAVMLASILIYIKDLHIIDPLLSLFIVLYILIKVVQNLKATILIFLQKVPPDVKISQIRKAVLKLKGVHGMCNTNLWSLDGQHNVLSTCVAVKDGVKGEVVFTLKKKIKKIVSEFNIDHITIEMGRKSEYADVKADQVEEDESEGKMNKLWNHIVPKSKVAKIIIVVSFAIFLLVLFFVTPPSEEHEHDPNRPGAEEVHDDHHDE